MKTSWVPSRRKFLRTAAAIPLASLVRGAAEIEEIFPGLRILRGAVNTALFLRNGRTLLIDSGELESTPGGGVAEWVLFTHHHPDQASAGPSLAATGVKVVVPAAERRFFEDALAVWDSADSRFDHDMNCRPDLTTLRDPIPVTLAVKDGDVHVWEGLRFEVIGTPGHTDGSVTYLVELDGKRIAFTGDLIYTPARSTICTACRRPFQGWKAATGDSAERLTMSRPAWSAY